jgi:hypothetical protein
VAPVIGFNDPAGQHAMTGFEALPDDLQAELIDTNECGQVRASKGSVRHVEVFLMGRCENSHHRKTSTLTRRTTRRKGDHPG